MCGRVYLTNIRPGLALVGPGIASVVTALSLSPSPGVQRLHGREAAVLQAVPGVCHPAPEPEEGVRQLHVSPAPGEVAFLLIGTAVRCSAPRAGGVSGEG